MGKSIFVIVISLVFLVGFILVTKPKKKDIQLNLHETFESLDQQTEAIKKELRNRGKEVIYKGNGHFIVDGNTYVLQDTAGKKNYPTPFIPIADIPERTDQKIILKRFDKGSMHNDM